MLHPVDTIKPNFLYQSNKSIEAYYWNPVIVSHIYVRSLFEFQPIKKQWQNSLTELSSNIKNNYYMVEINWLPSSNKIQRKFSESSSLPIVQYTTQKMKFSIKDLFSKCVTSTEEILNGKLHFLVQWYVQWILQSNLQSNILDGDVIYFYRNG